MSFKILAERKAALELGCKQKAIDKNNDGVFEAQKLLREDGSVFYEQFDFDSNGAKDYDIYRDEQGKFVSCNYYSNNPEDNQVETPNFFKALKTVISAKLLSKEANEAETTFMDGLFQINEKELDMHTKMNSLARDYYKEHSEEYSEEISKLYADLNAKSE